MNYYKYLTLLFFLTVNIIAQSNSDIQELAADFFEWRKITQPSTEDDILRVERPDGWVPDFSPEALEAIKQKYIEYSTRLKNLSRENWSRSDSVDFLLMQPV